MRKIKQLFVLVMLFLMASTTFAQKYQSFGVSAAKGSVIDGTYNAIDIYLDPDSHDAIKDDSNVDKYYLYLLEGESGQTIADQSFADDAVYVGHPSSWRSSLGQYVCFQSSFNLAPLTDNTYLYVVYDDGTNQSTAIIKNCASLLGYNSQAIFDFYLITLYSLVEGVDYLYLSETPEGFEPTAEGDGYLLSKIEEVESLSKATDTEEITEAITNGLAELEALKGTSPANEDVDAIVEAIKKIVYHANPKTAMLGVGPINSTTRILLSGKPNAAVVVSKDDFDGCFDFYAPTELDDNGYGVLEVAFGIVTDDMAERARMHVATFNISIEGIDIEPVVVNGIAPALSWNEDVLQRELYKPMLTSGERTIELWAVGYNVPGTIYENAPKLTFGVTGLNAREFEVMSFEPAGDPIVEMGMSKQRYELVVNYTPSSKNADKAVVFVSDLLFKDEATDYTALTMNIDAQPAEFWIVDENGNPIDQIDFPLEGGKKVIGIAYDNFYGVADYANVYGESVNGDVKLKFIDSWEPKKHTADLEGTGVVYVEVACGPQLSHGVMTDEVEFSLGDVVKQVLTVTRTWPDVWRIQPEAQTKDPIFIGGADFWNYNHEVEFVVKDLVNYYSVDDIKAYTDLSVFKIENAGRWKVVPAGKDGDYVITLNISYVPCKAHDVDHGHIYVTVPGSVCVAELEGEAGDEETVAAVKGETNGIQNVAAESKDGAIYTISGVRANKSTKGLVIENGVKVIK